MNPSSNPIDLEHLGLDPSRVGPIEEGLVPARVALEHRGSYVLMSALGETPATITGRLRHEARSRADLPAVGDRVTLKILPGEKKGQIQQVLPRTSAFTRKVAGLDTEEQVLAANVDIIFLVSALNQDLNVRRVERYLTMAWASGATPVIVASKADLIEDVEGVLAELEAVAAGCDVVAVSIITDQGIEKLRGYFSGSRTVALLGSSGVGKSSIVNRLIGEDHQTVKDLRGDGRGRHTTSHRELLLVPGGGSIIDTPGLRELQLWEAGEGFDSTFQDVTDLAANCKFNDCAHDGEPGCAVAAALASGELAGERFESYQKLQRELAHLARRKDKRLAKEETKKWKRASAQSRARTRHD